MQGGEQGSRAAGQQGSRAGDKGKRIGECCKGTAKGMQWG